VKITIVEAGPALLGPFDKALQDYAHGLFRKRDVDVRLGTAVIGVEDFEGEGYHFSPAKRALLSSGETLEFGTMVWSAGLAPRTFTEDLPEGPFPRHPRNRRLLVDQYLRVKGHEGSIWAIGDAAINETGVPLPQLAQVARQQGMYLAKVFNGTLKEDEKPFSFFSLGSMASMGEMKAVYDGSTAGPLRDRSDETSQASRWIPPALKGFSALLLWRFAYWGRQTSVVNKILIPMHWLKTFFFGRDTSRY
jgi:NADH dehydrogenase FAD-containing subunit